MEKEGVSEKDKKIAIFTKALGNPIRIAIIRILMEQGTCTCGENCAGELCKCGCKCGSMVDRLPMAQSTISQHIKELLSAGLVTRKSRKGNYKLNHSAIKEGLDALTKLFDNLNNNIEMEEIKTGENGEACRCGDNCDCGENCNCGEEKRCCPDCNCQ